MKPTIINKTEALQGIQTLAQDCADAEKDAVAFRAIYQAELDQVHAKHSEQMRSHISKAAALREKLLAEVALDQGLFDKPKSYNYDALSYGWRLESDSIIATDEAKTIAMIEKHLPLFSGSLIKITKKLKNAALKTVAEEARARIGLVYTAARDAAFCVSKNDKQLRMPE